MNSSRTGEGRIISAAKRRFSWPWITRVENREETSDRCWGVGLMSVQASRKLWSLSRDRNSIASKRFDFPTDVRPRDTGEWAEVNRDILKVLESGDFETGEHVFTFNR